MSFDFLIPATSTGLPARGPLLDAAAEAGARSKVRDGWEVVRSFGDRDAEAAACAETVGFADLSHLVKLELQSTGTPALVDVFGPGVGRTARPLAGGWLCLQSPSLALTIGVAPGVVADLGAPGRVTDLTGALGAVVLVGPRAREVLSRFCALDARDRAMPVGDFRPVSVARTPGFVLRESAERFLILFGAACGEYIWTVLADAVGRLDGLAVGLDALPAIPEVSSDA